MAFSNINVPLILASLAFLVICLLSLGILIHIRTMRYRREVMDKIRTADDGWVEDQRKPQNLNFHGAASAGNAFVNFLSAVGIKTNPGRTTDDADIKLKFLKAGLRGRNVATVFWGVKFLLAVSFPLAFLTVAFIFFKGMNSSGMLTIAIFLSLLGLFLPDLWLAMKTAGRRDRIVKGFPDALDLLVVCVEAGMGLDGAIYRVGEELSLNQPELSEEFKSLNLEMRAGKARQTALKNLAERTGIEDVTSLVTVLLQTDRFGTSVAQALRVFADSFRTARYQRAEEAAAKIATKLLFPLVLCIFPAMFVVILGPIAITIYRVMINPS
jgi:tight adherence protein C